MTTLFLFPADLVLLSAETDFDTNISVDELDERATWFNINQDGTLSYDIDGAYGLNNGYIWKGISWEDMLLWYFNRLVEHATSPQSDMADEVVGLLIYANEHASLEDRKTFMEWLDKKMMLDAVSSNVAPSDHFECAEGKDWKYFEEIYENR